MLQVVRVWLQANLYSFSNTRTKAKGEEEPWRISEEVTTRHGEMNMFVVCVSYACTEYKVLDIHYAEQRYATLLSVIALGNNHRRAEKGPNRRRVQVALCRARLQVRLSVMKHSGLTNRVEVDGMDGDY